MEEYNYGSQLTNIRSLFHIFLNVKSSALLPHQSEIRFARIFNFMFVYCKMCHIIDIFCSSGSVRLINTKFRFFQ